jgi:hypothetical protein
MDLKSRGGPGWSFRNTRDTDSFLRALEMAQEAAGDGLEVRYWAQCWQCSSLAWNASCRTLGSRSVWLVKAASPKTSTTTTSPSLVFCLGISTKTSFRASTSASSNSNPEPEWVTGGLYNHAGLHKDVRENESRHFMSTVSRTCEGAPPDARSSEMWAWRQCEVESEEAQNTANSTGVLTARLR